ncbi:hypothetical protein NODU109028_14170 [Nocardioides dubius]
MSARIPRVLIAGACTGMVAALGSLAGCSSGGDGSNSTEFQTPDTESVRRADSSIRLPFEDYQLSRADRRRMQEGTAHLIDKCMQGRKQTGYLLTGSYLDSMPGIENFNPLNWGGPFGTLPLKHAEKYGYKPAPGGLSSPGSGFYLPSPADVGMGISEPGDHSDLLNSFHGRPDGTGRKGCVQEIEDRLDAPVDDISRLEADLNQLAREHPSVAGAMASWRDCMTEAGHEYDTVWSASLEFNSSPTSPRQIEVAVADVTCTEQSGWADYFYFVLADYQRQSIEQDPVVLESALKAEQKRFAAVERELARER